MFINIHTGNRTVAYLDILGFNSLLNKYPLEEIGRIYSAAVSAANKINLDKSLKSAICKTYILSDSLVVISPDSSFSSFISVVNYVKQIIQSFIKIQFPVRGAIAFGNMFINEQLSIFIGDGYLNAAKYEISDHYKQGFIGVSIDKSVEDAFPQFFSNVSFQEGLVQYPVPFEHHTRVLYTLNWLEPFSTNELLSMMRAAQVETTDPKVKLKYENTIKYIQYIDSIAHSVSFERPVLEELKGKSEEGEVVI